MDARTLRVPGEACTWRYMRTYIHTVHTIDAAESWKRRGVGAFVEIRGFASGMGVWRHPKHPARTAVRYLACKSRPAGTHRQESP